MKLTNRTFNNSIEALKNTYLNWELPEESVITWKNVLALAISEELFPKVIADWMLHKTVAPKNPAEIIQHGRNMFNAEYGSADTEAELIIKSARSAYYSTEDFEAFTDMYRDSFASILSGISYQEAYIKENIREHSSNPKVLILVYDELKGEVQDCFTGDAEHGVEFLRNHIKKNWNMKIDEVVKAFLVSGNTDFRKLTGNNCGLLEA